MDSTIQPYLPVYPRRRWLRRWTVLALIIGVVGGSGYGVLTLGRAHQVLESRENHSQEVAINLLWTLVAHGVTGEESAVGRLARKLIELREEPRSVLAIERSVPTTAKAALEHYYVYNGEFSTAANEIGWEFLEYKSKGETYFGYEKGNFEPKFIEKVLEASPGNLPNMLFLPPEPIRGYGNYRWQWLVIGLVAWWAVSVAIGMLLLRHRRIWQLKVERRFKARLSHESYDILHLIKQIEGHAYIKGYGELQEQARDLFKVALQNSTLSTQEVQEELASLRVIYRDRLAASSA